MNIILLEQEEYGGPEITLVGQRAKHVVKILRAEVGDLIKIGVLGGKAGTGIIRAVRSRQPYSVELELNLDQEPPNEPQVDLLLALPRPIMFKRVLSQAAALGTGRLYVVNAGRVEKSFWEASVVADGSWRDHLIRGLEQAVDTRLPAVTFHRGFKSFVDEELLRIREHYKYLLLAHPYCEHMLADVVNGGPGRVLLAVGPEGGWLEFEVERLVENGFSSFSIGPRILRVDTAVAALHGMVSLITRTSLHRRLA